MDTDPWHILNTRLRNVPPPRAEVRRANSEYYVRSTLEQINASEDGPLLNRAMAARGHPVREPSPRRNLTPADLEMVNNYRPELENFAQIEVELGMQNNHVAYNSEGCFPDLPSATPSALLRAERERLPLIECVIKVAVPRAGQPRAPRRTEARGEARRETGDRVGKAGSD